MILQVWSAVIHHVIWHFSLQMPRISVTKVPILSHSFCIRKGQAHPFHCGGSSRANSFPLWLEFLLVRFPSGAQMRCVLKIEQDCISLSSLFGYSPISMKHIYWPKSSMMLELQHHHSRNSFPSVLPSCRDLCSSPAKCRCVHGTEAADLTGSCVAKGSRLK